MSQNRTRTVTCGTWLCGALLLCAALQATACVEGPDSAPCTGTPLTCETFTRSDRCLLQDGCAMGDGCLVDPDSCQHTDEETCAEATGCAWAEGCTGEAAFCHQFLDADLCNNQQGCVYSNADHECIGTRTYCADINAAQCLQQYGCSLTAACEVATTSCAGLDPTTCAQRPTCVWGDGCLGEPVPCREKTTKSSCEWHAGCQWQ